MKAAFRSFFRQQTTWVGIIIAMLFQAVFGIVWMTGYDGVDQRLNELKVAIVADEALAGVIASMKDTLPLQTVMMSDIQLAQDALQARDVQMIMQLKLDAAQALGSATIPSLSLTSYLNEANAPMLKSMMGVIESKIEQGLKQSKLNMTLQAAGNEAVIQLLKSADMKAETVIVNPAGGIKRQMIPMMVVLASLVGSMLLALNLEQSSMRVANMVSRWRRFTVRVIINIGTAIAVSLIGTLLVNTLGGTIASGAWSFFVFQAVLVAAFMFTTQMFVVLFGQAGMVFNIILLSLQLVTSGAMVARPLLSEGYRAMSLWFPATYGVDGILNIMFGGTGTGKDIAVLVGIGLACFAISTVGVILRRDAKLQAPASA